MSTVPPRPAEAPPTALPAGTRLGEFEILQVLGIGGFGIVYLALDHALQREVAVKEYMPSALAGRTATLHVSLRSQNDAETFELGRRSFVNEARLLARFDHPSLLKVHRFWEDNGTAYMAMPVYRGPTLKKVREQRAAPADEAWLRRQLVPLLGALATLHGEGVFHRDIAPDNIVLEADGRPVLLDFGAARRVIGDKSQTLTAILKPAYAPIEQYAEATSLRQGPWTDFYALGATLHYLLLGRPPAPATARAMHDDHPPLAGQALPGCSAPFLAVIDWMLAPRPTDRPQSAAQLLAVLEGGEAIPRPAPVAPPPPPPADTWERTQAMPPRAPAASVAAPSSPPVPGPASPAAPAPAAPASGAGGRRMGWTVGGLTAVGVALAVALWPRGPATAPAAAGGAASAVPEAASAAVAASAAPAVPVLTAAPAGSAPSEPAPASRPAEAPAAASTAPRTPVRGVIKMPPNTGAPAHAAEPAAPVETPAAPAPASAPLPSARASEAATAAASAPARAPAPSDTCGKRVLLAWSLCMQNQCGRAELRQHPECVKWRHDRDLQANPVAN